ncbi:translocation/assembly module TamB domain-containing protein [Salegentibacter sediminis]|uniref:translocation/assembly module TamB domain-containing protein n=1 Tax=Salegentibacter sediminis TaxID=1930251 RepID=UPI0009C114C4|nr:translocation/assembly module TamB domain-containing protein [Salegentibacter sediminis]
MDKKSGKRTTGIKILKILAKIFAGFLILILLLILFIRSPWGQNLIIDKLTSSLAKKTNTKIEIERLFFTFSGNINLDGLYLEDQQGDTLVFSEKLKADIPFWPIIRGRGISVNSLDWSGVKANIHREDSLEGFNFNYLVKALTASDTTSSQDTTQAAPMQIEIGEVQLNNIYIKYDDKVSGINSEIELGSLNLEMDKTDLEQMEFQVADLELENSRIKYHQAKAFPETDEKGAPLPKLSANSVRLKNIEARYNSVPDSVEVEADIFRFFSSRPDLNLPENRIAVDQIKLEDSWVAVDIQTNPEKISQDNQEDFSWPEYYLSLNELNLENNSFTFTENSLEPQRDTFNATAIALEKLNGRATDFLFKDQKVLLTLETLTFNEYSGMDLKKFSGEFEVTDRGMDFSNLQFQLNQNKLQGEFLMEYASINDLIQAPGNSILSLDLSQINFDLKELFKFEPELRQNEYLLALSKKPVIGQVQAQGKLAELSVPMVKIYWGDTYINANGQINNATDPEKISFNFPNAKIVSTRNDLTSFIDENSLGIRIPDEIDLQGSLSGTPTNVTADLILNSSDGQIDLKGNFQNDEQIAFNADLTTSKLNLGSLLSNKSMGIINVDLTASGSGNNINSMDAELEGMINSFSYNEYAIKELPITGELENGSGMFKSSYQDENLEAVMQANVQLDSVAPGAQIDLNLKGADLQALGFTSRHIKTGFKLRADFKGNAENYDISAQLRDAIAVYDNEPYFAGDLQLDAHVTPDTTALHINNRILELSLESNADPIDFAEALERHYLSYYRNTQIDTSSNPVNIKFRGEIREAPILTDVFISGLEEMDTIKLNMDFREKERELTAVVNFPLLQYGSNVIDSLAFRVNSNKENLDFEFGFNSLEGGPLLVKKTFLQGKMEDQKLYLDFVANDKDSLLVHVMTETRRKGDSVMVSLNSSELILNKNTWNIPDNNRIVYTQNKLEFSNFIISRKQQEVSLDNVSGNTEKEHIALNFRNFNLATIFNYFNPEKELAGGKMDGHLTLEEPFGSTAMLADLEVRDFRVMEAPLGVLNIDASAKGGGNYAMDLSTKGGELDMDLTGEYAANEQAAQLNLDLQINELQLSVLERFSQGEIKETSGSIAGNVKIGGTTLEPEYSGTLNFQDANFNIARLNANFELQQEKIAIDNEGIYLDDFTIRDRIDNKFVVSGEILTETYLNPEFDLRLEANNFNALNSTREDNDLFFGKANFDVDARITGDLKLPRIDGNLRVNSNTDLTYIMPDAELEMMERDGVVRFVNREDPDDILTGNTEEATAVVSGIVVNTIIDVDEDAVFTIIIDDNTGDNFRVAGEGELTFNIASNGRTSLSGRYVMNRGHYEMSLYELVKRRFEIVAGSSISWAGDPMEARLDISALYEVETSATSLMASGATTDVSGRFRQELPFQVYLNVDGELMQPQLSFGLDMPEAQQGAIGGQVYGRIQQLNQQEAELNKQVFSLLVLNRFFPEGGSDGSRGGTMNIARDNLNQALSDQLNRFSDQLVGETGIELNFGVDSFTDYQGESPQERTQLDITAQKRLMDDRLIVSVGSQVDVQGSNPTGESTPMIGNVSLEYLLTENGRFRLKGFRRNMYENVIDGQIIVSGIALIFTREFNKFKELFEKELQETQKEK